MSFQTYLICSISRKSEISKIIELLIKSPFFKSHGFAYANALKLRLTNINLFIIYLVYL